MAGNVVIEIASWSEFIYIVVTTKKVKLQYREDAVFYDIYASDSVIWHIRLKKGDADATDFENNYRAGANARHIIATQIVDATGNISADVIDDGSVSRLQVDARLSVGGATQNVVITDASTSSQTAAVDTSGRLLVSTQPVIPSTSTPVSGTADGIHSGVVTTYFILHSTKMTTVQRFICGGEGKKYTKVELYEDPAGTGTGMTLLAKGFIPEGGGNFSFDLNEEYVGNGTRRLAIRRSCSNSTETFAKWSGFEA